VLLFLCCGRRQGTIQPPSRMPRQERRARVEKALSAAGVPFSRSAVSKFRNFVRRTLE